MQDKGGIVLLGVMVACAFLLPVLFKRPQTSSYQLVPVRRSSPQLTSGISQYPLAQYNNEETWEVQYTPEGLVQRVIVKRHATQG